MYELLPLLEKARGSTIIGNWMVLINESYDHFSQVFIDSDHKKRSSLESVLTLNHEGVHFFQSYSMSFPYSYTLNLMNLGAEFFESARNGILSKKVLSKFRERYYSYSYRLNNREYYFSVSDLLESMAVTESFRATYQDTSIDSFKQYLREYFPYSGSVYRRVIDYALKKFDIYTVLEIITKLCFLALNGDTPGKNLKIFIDVLEKENIQGLSTWSTSEISTFFRMDPKDIFLNKFKNEERIGYQHKFLIPFLDEFLKLGDHNELLEIAGKPGVWMGSSDNEYDLLVPPIVLFNGGIAVRMGLGKKWTDAELYQYTTLAASMGIFHRLLSHEEPYHFCPHIKCPIHPTKLCHQWFSVPKRMHWSKCKFPALLELETKTDHKTLMNFR